MLQKEFKTVIAEAIQVACANIVCQIGASDTPPTDDDDGLKGAQVAAFEGPSDTDNAAFIFRSPAPINIPSGTAKEVIFKNTDNVVMDRLIISPITGGANVKIELEYRLEVVS